MKVVDILKTEDIIKVGQEETLTSVLSKLSSSHDAAFVFDENDKFLGVINPYYCVIKTSYPGNTKVKNCLYHPPKIRINDPLSKVVKMFIDSKVHYLSVFNEKDEFIGIVTARKVLSALSDNSVFQIKIKDYLKAKRKPLITLFDDDNINQALNRFKNERVSKIVVVNKDLRLKGILSYYDLIVYLTSPRVKETRGDRIGNKSNFYYRPIKNFVKSYVLTLSEDDRLRDALRLILDKKIGSVVVINELRHPIAIITTRDLLSFFFFPPNGKKIEIIVKNLSEKNRQILGGFFNRLKLSLQKFPQITAARVFVKEEKQGGLFKIVLSLFSKSGKPKIIKKEEKNLPQLLKKISR
jgi:CBS domain-containing protein